MNLAAFDGFIGHVIAQWGYVGVFTMLAVEGFGLFFVPGETTLIAAALFAGHTGRLNIALVLLAGFGGAVLGDNVAFQVGSRAGFGLLRRYGPAVRLNERRLKFVQYLYLRYGMPIVFVGRFVVILRLWESFLAGANAMRWAQFAPVNAAASLVWVMVWGLGAWAIGQTSKSMLAWLSAGIFGIVVIGLGVGAVYFRRHQAEFEAEADRALPGPLRAHRPADLRSTVAR